MNHSYLADILPQQSGEVPTFYKIVDSPEGLLDNTVSHVHNGHGAQEEQSGFSSNYISIQSVWKNAQKMEIEVKIGESPRTTAEEDYPKVSTYANQNIIKSGENRKTDRIDEGLPSQENNNFSQVQPNVLEMTSPQVASLDRQEIQECSRNLVQEFVDSLRPEQFAQYEQTHSTPSIPTNPSTLPTPETNLIGADRSDEQEDAPSISRSSRVIKKFNMKNTLKNHYNNSGRFGRRPSSAPFLEILAIKHKVNPEHFQQYCKILPKVKRVNFEIVEKIWSGSKVSFSDLPPQIQKGLEKKPELKENLSAISAMLKDCVKIYLKRYVVQGTFLQSRLKTKVEMIGSAQYLLYGLSHPTMSDHNKVLATAI